MGHSSMGGQKNLKNKNLIFSLKMAKMQRGVILAEIKDFIAKQNIFASFRLDSSGQTHYLGDVFFFQGGQLCEVISPKIEKLMTANFGS